MDHIGIDVHKMESQLCILGAGSEMIERRVRTSPERFAEVLGAKAGHRRVRSLLVQVAVSILRGRHPATIPLREWAGRLAARRGRFINRGVGPAPGGDPLCDAP
jgi:hypothetical protein